MKVRIGYGLGTRTPVEPDGFITLVDALERHGFDSLWLSERVSGPVPDPLIGLAVAAGRTRKLKLGTSVLVLPGRNPVLLAKELASLDVLSGGRLLPAFGLGVANAAEHQAFGVERGERAAWFDEAMPLVRRLWTEDDVDHEGLRFTLRGVTVRPRPAQSPLEVWLGGRAPSELRRVGRLGDGWLPSFCTPSEVAAGRAVVEEAASATGRALDPEHFGAMVFYARSAVPDAMATALSARRPDVDPRELVMVGLDAVRGAIERFVDVGFSKFVVVPLEDPRSWEDEIEEAAALLSLQAAPASAQRAGALSAEARPA